MASEAQSVEAPTALCADEADDGLLWSERVMLLPSASRRAFFETVLCLSREAAASERRAAALAEELDRLRPPPSREDTLAQRDRVIFTALDGYSGPMTNRARDLASDLRRALGLRTLPSSDRMRVACEILRLNDGRTLSKGQIYQIWRKLNFSMSSHSE